MPPVTRRQKRVATKTAAHRLKTPLTPVMVISGSSASHRTKAVAMLAKELNAPLHRVDLGAVISQYIGETEKNVSRVLGEAERLDAILFFDEADALFARRTTVKDAHDRYANLDANYLLERLEQHEGLTILATNQRGKLDKRLQKYVHVPLGPAPKKTRVKKRRQ